MKRLSSDEKKDLNVQKESSFSCIMLDYIDEQSVSNESIGCWWKWRCTEPTNEIESEENIAGNPAVPSADEEMNGLGTNERFSFSHTNNNEQAKEHSFDRLPNLSTGGGHIGWWTTIDNISSWCIDTIGHW